jgi:DNA-binding transcriptional LysR family regulator
MFDQARAEQRIEARVALEASAADAIAGLAARGLAVGILSDSMAAFYQDQLTALTIEDVPTPVLLSLIWRAPHGPAVRELVEHTRRAFAVQELNPV